MTRILLVTGGASGIGEAVARLAAQRDYDVCINYRNNVRAAETLAEQLSCQFSVKTLAIRADVSQEAEVYDLFVRCQNELGQPSVLVNNAGIISPVGRLDQTSQAHLELLFSTNITGSFLCAKYAVKAMSTRYGGQGGVIINVSSIAASLGSAHEFVDYAASKGAIDTLTVGLAKEVATEGIRVNGVRPGIIDTALHAKAGVPDRTERTKKAIPMQRPGSAEEVAHTILWLASDQASYITGSSVDVSGGR